MPRQYICFTKSDISTYILIIAKIPYETSAYIIINVDKIEPHCIELYKTTTKKQALNSASSNYSRGREHSTASSNCGREMGGQVLTLQRRSRSTGAPLAWMSKGSASGPRTSMPSTPAQSSSISSRRRWYRPGDASGCCPPGIAAPLPQER